MGDRVYLDLVVPAHKLYHPLFNSTPANVRAWLQDNIDYISTYYVLPGKTLEFVSGEDYLKQTP